MALSTWGEKENLEPAHLAAHTHVCTAPSSLHSLWRPTASSANPRFLSTTRLTCEGHLRVNLAAISPDVEPMLISDQSGQTVPYIPTREAVEHLDRSPTKPAYFGN